MSPGGQTLVLPKTSGHVGTYERNDSGWNGYGMSAPLPSWRRSRGRGGPANQSEVRVWSFRRRFTRPRDRLRRSLHAKRSVDAGLNVRPDLNERRWRGIGDEVLAVGSRNRSARGWCTDQLRLSVARRRRSSVGWACRAALGVVSPAPFPKSRGGCNLDIPEGFVVALRAVDLFGDSGRAAAPIPSAEACRRCPRSGGRFSRSFRAALV